MLGSSRISNCAVTRSVYRSCSTNPTTNSVGCQFKITGTLLDKRPTAGKYAEIKHVFPQEHVNTFASICGDNNPLHSDPDFAKTTIFGGTIVHGIFVSSLFSTIFGRLIHGSIYVSQSLNFKRPVYVGKEVCARIEVVTSERKRKGHLLTCSSTVTDENGNIAVVGEAKVLVPFDAVGDNISWLFLCRFANFPFWLCERMHS